VRGSHLRTLKATALQDRQRGILVKSLEGLRKRDEGLIRKNHKTSAKGAKGSSNLDQSLSGSPGFYAKKEVKR